MRAVEVIDLFVVPILRLILVTIRIRPISNLMLDSAYDEVEDGLTCECFQDLRTGSLVIALVIPIERCSHHLRHRLVDDVFGSSFDSRSNRLSGHTDYISFASGTHWLVSFWFVVVPLRPIG